MSRQKQDQAQTFYDFGGTGAPLHLAIANGFPPQTYALMLQPLLSDFSAFSWLPRALWEPPPPLSSASSWMQMAHDLLAGLKSQQHSEPIVGVGHSMGGVATMLAAVLEPQRFRGIVLLDPVFLPPSVLWLLRGIRRLGLSSRLPLSRSAKRRKARFSSPDEAFTYWRNKPLFQDWSDEVLRAYTTGLLVQQEGEDNTWRLRWEPLWEAHYYETMYTRTWRYLRKMRKDLPVLVVRGANTDALLPAAVKRLQRVLPHMDFVELGGVGHLFPLAVPTKTAEVIDAWLTQRRLR